MKFVKERTEIEQNYAKQLRQASIISIVFSYFSSMVHFRILAVQNPCLCLHGCIWLFLKSLCGLVISTGQNLTSL